MVGCSPNFTPFNPESRITWFFADLYGIALMWAFQFFLLILSCGISYKATGIMITEFFASTVHALTVSLGYNWMLGVVSVVTLIPPFILVFVLRLNPAVIGVRRPFRYVFSWL